MLLTLAASSLKPYLRKEPGLERAARTGAGARGPAGAAGAGGGGGAAAAPSLLLTDLPRYAREELTLFGLNITTDLLVGADYARLDDIRDSADKASCPCLVLIESEPQPFCDPRPEVGEAVIERLGRVAKAAHRLGCNSAALAITGANTEAALDLASTRLRKALQAAERLEINILLNSYPGLTADPERLTDLIKKIGGFRIGTFPDFQAASKAADPPHFLRRLTPYASAVTASSVKFKPVKGGDAPDSAATHEPYDLAEYARTVLSVGYTGTMAIDYRGTDDPAAAITRTRTILEGVLGTEAGPP